MPHQDVICVFESAEVCSLIVTADKGGKASSTCWRPFEAAASRRRVSAADADKDMAALC